MSGIVSTLAKRLAGAALKLDKEGTFFANSHNDANATALKHGVPFDKVDNAEHDDFGFITNHGQFVPYEEAMKIHGFDSNNKEWWDFNTDNMNFNISPGKLKGPGDPEFDRVLQEIINKVPR